MEVWSSLAGNCKLGIQCWIVLVCETKLDDCGKGKREYRAMSDPDAFRFDLNFERDGSGKGKEEEKR